MEMFLSSRGTHFIKSADITRAQFIMFDRYKPSLLLS